MASSPYGRMTPQQVKAWQARVAQNPHAAYAAAAAHKAAANTMSTRPAASPNKLTPAQAKQLIANQQVVAPGLTQAQLNQNVNAQANMKYGDAQRQLATAPNRIGDFYTQYQQAIRQAQDQQAQVNAQATGGIKSLQGGLDQAAAQQWAGQQAATSADAASRGATADPALADQAKNAANIRGILTGSYGAMLTNQGANASTSLVNKGVTAKQAEGEQKSAAANQLANLLKEKGTYKTQAASQLISDASKNALNQALAENTIQTGNANRQLTNAKTINQKTLTAFVQKYGYTPGTQPSKLDQAKLDYFNKHGYFPPTGPPKKTSVSNAKDPYGNTPLQRTTRTSDFRKALTMASTLKSHTGVGTIPGIPPGMVKDAQVKKLVQGLTAVYPSANIDLLTGAAQQAVYGHVGPNVRKALTKLGVDSQYWG